MGGMEEKYLSSAKFPLSAESERCANISEQALIYLEINDVNILHFHFWGGNPHFHLQGDKFLNGFMERINSINPIY